MSKNLIRPSDIRAGLQDIEMAEDTVNLVYQNLMSDQAHLREDPIDIKTLPEHFQGISLKGNEGNTADRQEEEEYEDDTESEDIDPMEELQDFLDDLGSQILSRLKKGDKIKKIWPGASLSIQNFVKTKFLSKISDAVCEDKFSQTDPIMSFCEGSTIPSESLEYEKEVEMRDDESNQCCSELHEDEEVEAEIAHQVGESFAKKYKFPSRSSGIFLWNFEQLKMNLDDIVKTAQEVPGIIEWAREGKNLPLRGILGYVGLKHSKRFQLLVDQDRMSNLIQKDLDSYSVKK
ncbi:phosphoprotein [Ikoma lyssavirus]|uniref:Phosphoprotein n=1 Tax=Ikoma lyssavirus TaxID=1167696 RepID=J7JWQ7_9RHAB|nr:phosphoprotein [Ikoma lyssavirus]AFQ62095.1 phosphoprotein [Ikoma lyssavirus]